MQCWSGAVMRNLVLITLDSVRADHCGFMGYSRETTPTLDKMAKKGLVFENAIAAGIGTPSSMMGTFTGKFAPLVERVNPILWRKEFQRRTTIAEKLSKLGYSTGAFVPNAFASRYFGFNKGFQYFEDYLGGNKKLFEKIFENAIIKNSRISFIVRNLINFISKREVFTPWTKYYEDVISWVDKVKEPFFLWVLVMDTHFPYLAPKECRKWCNVLEMFFANWKLQSVNFEDKLSKVDRLRLINAYDCSIRFADEFVKQLWKDMSSYDPVFVIHADHGDGFGEHGYYMHGFVKNTSVCLYEELIHVPFVIYNLNRMSGMISKPFSLLNFSDILNNIVYDESISWESDFAIVPAVDKYGMKISIRSSSWKFIKHQLGLCELYNLKLDPLERNNVYNKYKFSKDFEKLADYYIQEFKRKKFIRNIVNLKLANRGI